MSFRGLFAKAGLHADGRDIEMIRGAFVTNIVNQVWVSKDGNDTSGKGTIANPFLTIGQAFTVVTAARNVVMLLPGTYIEDELVWPDVTGVVLIGSAQWTTTIIGKAGNTDQLISISPTIVGTFEATINDIYLDHGEAAGQDGLLITNSATTGKILVYLRNFGSDGTSTDQAIKTDHSGRSDEAIRIYMDGSNGGIDKDIYLDIKNNGDRFSMTGCSAPEGGVETTTDNIAAALTFTNCWNFPEGSNESVKGGHASQTVAMIGCYTDAPAISAAGDVETHTETIVGG